MTINVGDRVEIDRFVSRFGDVAKNRGRGLAPITLRGTVSWTGPKFCVVQLDVGYRESFWYDELRPARQRVKATA